MPARVSLRQKHRGHTACAGVPTAAGTAGPSEGAGASQKSASPRDAQGFLVWLHVGANPSPPGNGEQQMHPLRAQPSPAQPSLHPTDPGERPAHPTPPLASQPQLLTTLISRTGVESTGFPQGLLRSSWEWMAENLEGFLEPLCGHVTPVPLSQGLFGPCGKGLCVPPLSSPASKLLFSAVDASQAKGQRGVYLPAPNQLLVQLPPKHGPPRDAAQTLHQALIQPQN